MLEYLRIIAEMARITMRIVTNSTCDLPVELINQYGITVIPLYINMGDESYLDGINISRREFYERMPNYDPPPTTATPGVDAFQSIYEELAASGATDIISILISASLSATVNVAEKAALGMGKIKVTVYDAGQLSLGTGFVVLKAAQLAEEGASVTGIMDIIQQQAQRTHGIAALDSLEYLRRSGRLNKFMAGIGKILQIKPILTMDNQVRSKCEQKV
jgi:DegV family protein with EDD domain